MLHFGGKPVNKTEKIPAIMESISKQELDLSFSNYKGPSSHLLKCSL